MSDGACDWLQANGDDWRSAVHTAVEELQQKYVERFQNLTPINIFRLAHTRNAKIITVPGLSSRGRLMPANSGFHLLIPPTLKREQLRSVVAHELAHTLFYSQTEGKKPQRLFPATEREHSFCYDVGRLALAPPWFLERLGVFAEEDPGRVFDLLVRRAKLGRGWAARVMLADYHLFTGVAYRWRNEHSCGWRIARGNAWSSPMDEESRAFLRSLCERWLRERIAPTERYFFQQIPERPYGGWNSDTPSVFTLLVDRENAPQRSGTF